MIGHGFRGMLSGFGAIVAPSVTTTGAVTAVGVTSTSDVAVTNGNPILSLNETDQAANYRLWWVDAAGAEFRVSAIDDAVSVAKRALSIGRTGTDVDYVRVGASAAPVRLDVTGGVAAATPPATKTGTPYTMVALSDYAVSFDPTAASQTVNLPAAASCRGTVFVIRKNVAHGNTVTIDPNASETIEGAATLVVASNTAAMIQSDGTNWRLLGVMT